MAELLLDFDILQQISVLLWTHSGNSRMAETLAGIKLGGDLWRKLSHEEEMEALRTETILNISKYVKEHPKASQEELLNEIGKEIVMFANKVEKV